jgi:hypothetical protein
MQQEFALTEEFCGAVMTSEKEHNACIRAFLGDQDYQKMLATGARRLAEKSPIKYSRESTWILPASRLVNLRKALSLTVLRVSLSLEPNPQEHGCCRRCKHC